MARGTLLHIVWQQHRALLVLLLLLSAAVAWLLIVNDQVVAPRLASEQRRMTTLQQQIRQYQQLMTQNGVPLSTTERVAADLVKFRGLIPPKQDFSEFIGDLFGWAHQAELDIQQVSYQPKLEPQTGMVWYGLSFSVTGDYAQLKRFIHLLENSERLLIIDKISLARGEQRDDESDAVRLQIQLTTFFREHPQ